MKVLEVRVINHAPKTGHRFKYLVNVKPGVIARRSAYCKDGVISRDSNYEGLTELVKKGIASFSYKRRLVSLLKEI